MPNPSPDPTPPGEGTLQRSRVWAGKLLRAAVVFAIFGYLAGLAFVYVALELIGERSWPLAVLLYLPQGIFLLPLIILIPAALLAELPARTLVLWLGAVLIIFLWHVPFYAGMSGAPARVKMKLITNNYSQNHGLTLQPFISAEDPDFVALEDVANQASAFQRSYPQRTVRGIGQFILISKTPVKSATLLGWPTWRGMPVAAVFVVPWQGEDVAIYAVHMPSPRADFAKLAGLGIVKELAGRNRRRSDGMSFGESMTARVQLAHDLAGVLAREKRPFVAMGDFNMPSNGYVRRVITPGLTDCFAQVGRGFGFTFPCDRHNPLTLGNPWLRLDYIFGGPGWHADECRVEPGRRSKHRAVVATLSRN
jgi:endonuclease/exonuclease/phosphatase family metal-dependent hydrolase